MPDLARVGDVRSAVGLQVEADDFDGADFGNAFGHQVDLGADQVGDGEGFGARQDAHADVSRGGDFGVLDVYVRPHPEPKSLPRNFPTIRHCSVRGTWQPELMADLAVLNKYGLLDEENGPRTKEAIWSRRGGIVGKEHFGQFAARIEVGGTNGGGRVRRTYDIVVPPDGSTYPLTGTCAGGDVRRQYRMIRLPRQEGEGLGQQGIAGENRESLAVHDVRGRSPATQHVVVHGR